MKSADAIWLAGLLEGEGCFGRKAHTPTIQLNMTDRDVVERAASIMDVALYGPYSKGDGHKDQWVACAAGRKAITVMMAIRSQMGQRRGQKIDETLEWARNRSGKKRGEAHYASRLSHQIVLLVRCLWRRGVTTAALARITGVTSAAIRNCVHRRTWKHIS